MNTENLITKLEKAKELYSHRIKLRPFAIDDISDVYEYASDDNVTEYLNWPSYTKFEDISEIINLYYLSKPGVWAIELQEEQKCIGAIDLRLSEDHQKASVGYVLNKAYWNKGYMTESLQTVISFAFKELNLNRFEATHYIGNEGSGKVMQKCKMKYEGTGIQEVFIKNVFRDVVHYAILKRDWVEANNN